MWAQEKQSGFTVTSSNRPAGSDGLKVDNANFTGTLLETWNGTLTGSDSSKNPSQSYQKSYYWQIGAKGNMTTAVFTTSGITGYIRKIEVDCCAYSSNGEVSVTVGGKTFGTSPQTMPIWNSSESGADCGGVLTFEGYASGNIEVRLAPTTGGRAIYLHSITVTFASNYSANITSTSGFATLFTPYALDFSSLSSELKAYTATSDGSTVTLTEVSNVPANTGVVLKGDVKSHTIPVIASSETAKGSLEGSVTDDMNYNGKSGYDLYMLALNASDEAQFKKVTSGSIVAGKAYLPIAAGGGAHVLNVVFDGQTTGISEMKNVRNMEEHIYYNLAGQRVAQPTKGLYIVNGKKVIIK